MLRRAAAPARVRRSFSSKPPSPYYSHPSSVVNTKHIGNGTRISAGAVVGEAVKIGCNSIIGARAVLDNCEIGNNVVIKPGACIGQDGFGFIPTPNGNVKKPQTRKVIIEDDVEIGANTCIDRGSWRDTIIKKGTKIDNLVQIGHNAHIGSECLIAAQCGIAGSATLGDGVLMGGQAGVKDHVKVGSKARIAAKSAVLQNVGDGEECAGYPAIRLTEWKKQIVSRKRTLVKSN